MENSNYGNKSTKQQVHLTKKHRAKNFAAIICTAEKCQVPTPALIFYLPNSIIIFSNK